MNRHIRYHYYDQNIMLREENENIYGTIFFMRPKWWSHSMIIVWCWLTLLHRNELHTTNLVTWWWFEISENFREAPWQLVHAFDECDCDKKCGMHMQNTFMQFVPSRKKFQTELILFPDIINCNEYDHQFARIKKIVP